MGSRTTLTLVFLALCAGPTVGEEVEVVLREGTNFAAARSPTDGSFVLDLQGTLWRLPSDGGDATALTDALGDARQPHISPDGTRIVFQSYRSGTWDLWTVGTDGTGLEAITESRFDDREPMFSPDGTRVAFSSDRNRNYDVWVLDLASGDLVAITRDDANDYMPAWSPSGDSIAFVSDRGASTALYRVDLDAESPSEPVRIGAVDGVVSVPSWSPDGTRIAARVLGLDSIAFGARGPLPTESVLVLFSIESGDATRVSTPDDVFPFRAEWASATELYYTAAGSLWRHSLDGGTDPVAIPFAAKVTLVREPSPSRALAPGGPDHPVAVRGIVKPVVSPDGSSIAFAALGDIWVVPSGGGEPLPLTRDEHLDTDPTWSPDGLSLAYASDRFGTMDILIRRVSDSHREIGRQLTYASGAELAPVWSPDGTRIAYVDERSRIHTVSVDGGVDETLTPPRSGVSGPTWSRDGAYLAFAVHERASTRFREGFNRIHVLDVQTGTSRVIAPKKSIGTRDGDGPVWSPDGRTLAFAMDGGLWTMAVAPDGTPRDEPAEAVREAVDFPSWTPDGESLLFVASKGIKQVDVETGRARYLDVRHEFEPSSAAGRFVIRDVRVIDGVGREPLEHRDVVVDGTRIESIEPTSSATSPDVRAIDGAGKTLIPGLVDMHTHLSLPSWGARHGKIWLSYGVTSIRVLSGSPYRILEERESIRAGRRIGPRMFWSGDGVDGDRVYYKNFVAIDNETELAREMQRAFDLGYDLVKTYVRLPDDLQELAIEEAHRQGIFVTSHELYPAVAYGVDGVEHLSGTSRRGYSPKLSDLRRSYGDVVDLMSRSRVFFTPTLAIQGGWTLVLSREPDLLNESRFQSLFPPWAQSQVARKSEPDRLGDLQAAVEPLFETVDAVAEGGGRILAGTDSPIVPYGLGSLVEIELLAEAGLGPMEALQSATRVAAEALGVGDELGTIEVGKIADLVLLGGNPIDDVRNLRKTELVIVNGRLLSVDQLLRAR